MGMAEDVLTAKLKCVAAKALATKRSSNTAELSSESLAQATILLMQLQSLSSALDVRTGHVVANEEDVRTRLAEIDEQLRMLKYQRARLQRAVDTCTESSEVAAGLFAELLQEDKGQAEGANKSATPNKAHQWALRRLGIERDGRARLCVKRKVLVSRLESLADAITRALERKYAIDEQLAAVVAAAGPLRLSMPMPPSSNSRLGTHSPSLLALLPAPLYTVAYGCAAYLVAAKVDGVLDIAGDALAAEALACAAQDGTVVSNADNEDRTAVAAGASISLLIAAHPLTLSLELRAGASCAIITFTYHPQLHLLAASASPLPADAALRGLGHRLRSAINEATSCGGADQPDDDDGAAFPDLNASLLARLRGADEADAVAISELLPHRPYKWLQRLGGLGPLLTAQPLPSHAVLDMLVRTIGNALPTPISISKQCE